MLPPGGFLYGPSSRKPTLQSHLFELRKNPSIPPAKRSLDYQEQQVSGKNPDFIEEPIPFYSFSKSVSFDVHTLPNGKTTPSEKGFRRQYEHDINLSLPEISQTALKQGLKKMAYKLQACSDDGMFYVHPHGHKFGFVSMGCHHRLCPHCHINHARAIRTRLETVIDRAFLHVVLTWPTYSDSCLKRNIKHGRDAFRKLTQSKGKKKTAWRPFPGGYFWRLEVTNGRGFHPHLHLLSPSTWVDQKELQKRWSDCLGHTGHVNVCQIDEFASLEVAKYLSKPIINFNPKRWLPLDSGLAGVRTFGSGGCLKLPKKVSSGNILIGTASRYFTERGLENDRGLSDWIDDNPESFDCLQDGPLKKSLQNHKRY